MKYSFSFLIQLFAMLVSNLVSSEEKVRPRYAEFSILNSICVFAILNLTQTNKR